VSLERLRAGLDAGRITSETTVGRVAAGELPTVGVDEPLSALFGQWSSSPAVAVLRDGELVDVVSPSDLTLR
jgi:predicted transcriptional regulator